MAVPTRVTAEVAAGASSAGRGLHLATAGRPDPFRRPVGATHLIRGKAGHELAELTPVTRPNGCSSDDRPGVAGVSSSSSGSSSGAARRTPERPKTGRETCGRPRSASGRSDRLDSFASEKARPGSSRPGSWTSSASSPTSATSTISRRPSRAHRDAALAVGPEADRLARPPAGSGWRPLSPSRSARRTRRR